MTRINELNYLEDAELRFQAEGDQTRIIGYAAKYNSLSNEIRVGSVKFREKIRPGAFDKCLAGTPDIRALVGHDPNAVLGRTPHTLKVQADEVGLRFECLVPNTTVGRDAVESLKRQDIRGCSFGFRGNTKDRWYVENGTEIREIEAFDEVFDLSLTAFPAYEATEVALRSREQAGSEATNLNANRRAELTLVEKA